MCVCACLCHLCCSLSVVFVCVCVCASSFSFTINLYLDPENNAGWKEIELSSKTGPACNKMLNDWKFVLKLKCCTCPNWIDGKKMSQFTQISSFATAFHPIYSFKMYKDLILLWTDAVVNEIKSTSRLEQVSVIFTREKWHRQSTKRCRT